MSDDHQFTSAEAEIEFWRARSKEADLKVKEAKDELEEFQGCLQRTRCGCDLCLLFVLGCLRCLSLGV
jgi:hypothetical protein